MILYCLPGFKLTPNTITTHQLSRPSCLPPPTIPLVSLRERGIRTPRRSLPTSLVSVRQKRPWIRFVLMTLTRLKDSQLLTKLRHLNFSRTFLNTLNRMNLGLNFSYSTGTMSTSNLSLTKCESSSWLICSHTLNQVNQL